MVPCLFLVRVLTHFLKIMINKSTKPVEPFYKAQLCKSIFCQYHGQGDLQPAKMGFSSYYRAHNGHSSQHSVTGNIRDLSQLLGEILPVYRFLPETKIALASYPLKSCDRHYYLFTPKQLTGQPLFFAARSYLSFRN